MIARSGVTPVPGGRDWPGMHLLTVVSHLDKRCKLFMTGVSSENCLGC